MSRSGMGDTLRWKTTYRSLGLLSVSSKFTCKSIHDESMAIIYFYICGWFKADLVTPLINIPINNTTFPSLTTIDIWLDKTVSVTAFSTILAVWMGRSREPNCWKRWKLAQHCTINPTIKDDRVWFYNVVASDNKKNNRGLQMTFMKSGKGDSRKPFWLRPFEHRMH